MIKKNIGIIICLVGIALMGYQLGVNSKTGESESGLTWIGLAIVFFGIIIFAQLNKKDSKK